MTKYREFPFRAWKGPTFFNNVTFLIMLLFLSFPNNVTFSLCAIGLMGTCYIGVAKNAVCDCLRD